MSLDLPGNGIKITLTGEDQGVDALLARIKRHADAVDKAIGKIDKNIVQTATGVKDVGVQADRGAGGVANLFNQFLGANLAMSALAKVQQGVGSFFGKLQEATQFQTQSMALAGDLGTNLGMGFKQANEAVLDIQKQIAKEAAVLPGVTKQYNDVFNALGGSVAKVFPSDLPKFREAVMDVTKRVGMLAAVKHVDSTEAGTAISRAISGTTGLGELMQMALFERSPQFTAALRAETAKIGLDLKDWKNSTDKIRLGVVQRALKIATPDSLIGEFEDTVESLWQGIQTRINDPLTGMFGFLRDIPSLNNTTVMDAVKDFLQAFVRMTTQFGRLAKDLGIDFDPLAPVARFIRWLASVQYAIGAAFEYRTFNLENIFGLTDIAKNLGIWVNQAAQNIFRALESVDTKSAGHVIGIVFSAIPNFISNIFKSINWANLGFVIGAAIGKYFLAWQIALPRNLVALGELFLTGLWSIFSGLLGILLGLLYGLFIEPIKPVLKALADPIIGFFTWLSDSIKGVWDTVKGLFTGVTNTLNLPGQAVQGLVPDVGTMMSPAAPLIKVGVNAVGALWDKVTGKKKDDSTQESPTKVKSSTGEPVIVPTTGTVLPSVTPLPSAVSPAVPETPAAPKKVAMLTDTPVLRMSGQGVSRPLTPTPIPVQPLGAPDTIAMGEPTALPLPAVQSQTTNNGGTYAPQINIPVTNGISDPNSLATTIASVLERQYTDFKRARLAASV